MLCLVKFKRNANNRLRLYSGLSLPNFDANFPFLKTVCKDPLVYEIEDFLSDAQCDSIIDIAKQKGELVTTSRTYLLHKNETAAQSNLVRNSTTWYVDFTLVDELCGKVSTLTGHAISTFEEPQVVRYLPGQYYSWHQDAIPKGKVNILAGNRVATVLVYLNTIHVNEIKSNPVSDSYSGCTSFRELDLHVRPVKGKCLVFFPCFFDGTPDPRTVHCSQPFEKVGSEKWIAQLWVHQRSY